MAINFTKNIFEGNIDDSTHEKFVRYGHGVFEKEEFIIKNGSKVQIWAGFEYLDAFFHLMAEVAEEPVQLKGIIVSKKDIKDKFARHGIELKKVTGKKYTIEEELSPEKFREFVEDFSEHYLLLNASSGVNVIKTGKSVPKPGKIVEKFVSAKFNKKHLPLIKKEFLFDSDKDFKEARIRHTYKIDEIVVDEELIQKDPLRARLEAKRKGTLIRKLTIDGQETVTEKEFEV